MKIWSIIAGLLLIAGIHDGTGQNAARRGGQWVECNVYPVTPLGYEKHGQQRCEAYHNGEYITLKNGFVSFRISSASGVIVSAENKLTGEQYPILGDQTGCSFTNQKGERIEWFAGRNEEQKFTVEFERNSRECKVFLTTRAAADSFGVTILYTLKQNEFWLERRLSIETDKVRYDQLIYGAAQIPTGTVNELKLGKFDSPRLIASGEGGIFCGVAWWFYEIKDGVYQNVGMNYETDGRFDSEPWYLGVFQPEPGEPYAGWLWYKTFLSERKLAYDKLRSHVLWNARSGYSFQPINNPDLLYFVGTAATIGLDAISTGEVRGLENGTSLARTNSAAREVIDTFARHGMTFGLHEGDVRATNWHTEAALKRKLQQIDAAAEQGIGNLTIDFLGINDRFSDHRRVARFFRHVREKMAYSECHLGMASYGPQFQREVIINHPTDLHNFDISRFSSDWATFMGFRQSRRAWQEKYQYLMPENGLFYFSSHYSNYPRNYSDPEPQQFLYIADAWRGLAYAFHDKFGFRNSVAAQAAFSTFYVFGFLDSGIPKEDAKFARDYLAWVKANSEQLNRSRVCFENEDALVMSKIQGDRGAFFALNYTPGQKNFKIKLELGRNKAVQIRQIYPQGKKSFQLHPGEAFAFTIAGESLSIFEVNEGLKGLPPENPSGLRIDVTQWQEKGANLESSFLLPNVRSSLAQMKDETLPDRVVSAEQIQTEFLKSKKAGISPGKLPREFLDAYGFEEDKFLPTWKAAPWAFADRVWFVYLPETPPRIGEKKPVLILNETRLEMTPRVRYHPKTKLANPEKWDAPLWFADVTDAALYGRENNIVLIGIKDKKPGVCFIAASLPTSNANDPKPGAGTKRVFRRH